MKRHFSKLVAIVAAACFLQVSCLAPVHAFSISEEREVGEKLLYSVRKAFPLIDDPDLVQYLAGLGREVLEVADLQYFDYRFYIINDKEFNAFAAPSGLVFFYSGLIGAMNREDELVSVLAHEIGHVAKRHLADRLEKGMYIGVASIAVALAAMALGGGAATQALMTSSIAAGQSASLHFSRKDEEEADLIAYGWMKKLERHPEGQMTMLETMRRVSRYRSEKLPQYLLTHPNPEDRLQYVQSLISMDREALAIFPVRDEFAFLRFKYRIMAQTSDSFAFREYLSGVIADGQASRLAKTMARYGLAQLEMGVKNFKGASEYLAQVMADLPGNNQLATDHGVMLYQAGSYEQARNVLETASRANPRDMYALYYLARTYQMLGDINQAQRLFATVSYTLPEYAKVYFDLGKIASLKKERVAAALYLGRYYLLEGKLESARHSLESVTRDKMATEKQQQEGEELLDLIERLEE